MSRIIEISVPDVGDADQIELVEWHKQAGDNFEQGDELCDLVTDKAAFSLEAPQKGRLVEILIGNKQSVKVGQKVARVEIGE